jgi:hypothetical protein
MGEIVNVVEQQSSRPGIVRFETNRVLSGTGHDRFVAGEPIEGDRPVVELARRLFGRGGISSVHVNGGMVTVDLAKGFTSEGLADIIRGLYTFYEPSADARPDAVAAEAALAAAPDAEAAATSPVLQDIAAAEAAGVPPLPTPGDQAVARNEAITAAAEPAADEGETA